MAQQQSTQQHGTQEYKCKECGHVCNTAEELRTHEKTHTGQAQKPAEKTYQAGGGEQQK